MCLNGKHILVGISGGIAAYKIPDLIRRYKKSGADVRVVATANALRFVTPLTLETVSCNPLYSDVFDNREPRTTAHVSLAQWADIFVVAPATANVIGKFAAGIGDDALTTQMLAFGGPRLIVPAMNEAMWHNPIVQANIRTLQDIGGMNVMMPAKGELACGVSGEGRMPEPEDILTATQDILTPQDLEDQSILITAGPTVENIDPVRFISNHSTGKMAYALADECRARGARVTVISGPVSVKVQHSDIEIIGVTTAQQMYEAALTCHAKNYFDGVILCAAVADYRPKTTSGSKIKRHEQNISLDLEATKDIAAALGKVKRQPDEWMLGFALETNDEQVNALKKMDSKNLDFIVLNSLRDEGAGFGCDTNKVTIFTRYKKEGKELELMSKAQVAKAIVDHIVEHKNK